MVLNQAPPPALLYRLCVLRVTHTSREHGGLAMQRWARDALDGRTLWPQGSSKHVHWVDLKPQLGRGSIHKMASERQVERAGGGWVVGGERKREKERLRGHGQTERAIDREGW